MTRLASIIDTYKTEFLAQFRHRLSPDHLRALAAIQRCRTQASPKMQLACGDCPHQHFIPHSCGHRHCPHCQHHESQRWLERQISRQVPASYFLLTFTIPAELRPLSWAHQGAFYELLLRCSWETVHTFSQNDKRLQGTPGAISVLHTHTRRLDYHPHVHMVMPAGAINAERRHWRTKGDLKTGASYLFNHQALAKVFRAKLLTAIEAAGWQLPARYARQWVVDCKAVGSGQKALVYLGRYLYRGVIREQDIVACGDGQVTFRFRNAKTSRVETRTLPGAQFLWLVLQHVLPKGFRRARNYGFLHPNRKRLIALLHVLLKFIPPAPPASIRPAMACPCCGAAMRIVKTLLRTMTPRPMPPPGMGQENH